MKGINNKKVYKANRKTIRGEMSVEASIVVPIIMLIIAFVLFTSFYLHDVVVTKTFIYSRVLETDHAKNGKTAEKLAQTAVIDAPVFVAENQIESVQTDKVTMESRYRFLLKGIKKILDTDKRVTIQFETSMNTEMMYLCKSVLDITED